MGKGSIHFDLAKVRQAEPAIQWVPRQSLGTRWWRSARSVNISESIPDDESCRRVDPLEMFGSEA